MLRLRLVLTLGSSGSGSTGMAGFGSCRPQPLGGRTAILAVFRWVLAVSRRMCVACWMRRSDQPQPSQKLRLCCFASFNTLVMPAEPTSLRGNQCPGRYSRWPVFR